MSTWARTFHEKVGSLPMRSFYSKSHYEARDLLRIICNRLKPLPVASGLQFNAIISKL
jgi:hypothetical protein